MIQTNSAFATANAKLQKQPTFVTLIQGYDRVFASRPGLSALGVVKQSAARTADYGTLAELPSTVTLTGPVTVGDPIFLFVYYAGTGMAEAIVSITDTGGNTWTSIYSDPGKVSAWYAIANANYPAGLAISVNGALLAGYLDGGNFEIFACEVPATYAGFHAAGANGTGSTASCTAGSTTVSFPVNAGSFWELVVVELAPASGSTPALTLTYVNVFISGPTPPAPGNLIIGAVQTQVLGNGPVLDWIVTIDDLKLTVSDLDGSSDLASLVFNVQDRGQAITADFPTFVFEGKQCQLLMGYVGLSLAYFVTLFTGVIDTVESDNGNNEYKFTVSDINLKKLTQVIYATGDDGFPTDKSHPKTLNGHPLDMLVSALQQAGVPLSSIDTNKIYFYRDTVFNGLSFEFTITTPPACKDFIEAELMKPLGMWLWENNLGLVSVNSFYPALSGGGSYSPPVYPVMTLDGTVETDNVPLEQGADLIDQVTFRFDWDETGQQQFLSESVQEWGPAILKYGLYGSQIIEAKGMRSSFQGWFMAALIARLIFLRYGTKPIVLDPLTTIWNACVLEPGDIIAVTNAFVPNRAAGALGLTALTFEVLDRNWKFMSGEVELKLLAIDLSKFKQYLITPNGEATYASDTAPNRAKYMYLDDQTTHEYSTSAPGNTLG